MGELTGHDDVQRWAQDKGMRPFAAVDRDGAVRTVSLGIPGRLDMSLFGSETIPQEIPWDQFFREFDAAVLALDTDHGEVCRRADAAA